MMQHRLWHCRQHKQRLGCISIDKVDSKRHANEGADGWCPSWPIGGRSKKKKYPQSQGLEMGEDLADLFFIPSILMHS